MSGGPPLALDHVQVAAPPGSESEAQRFYGDLLGLLELPKPPALAADGVWFALDAGELHVGVTDGFAPAAKAHPGLRLESVGALDRLAARLEKAGHPVEWDDRLPGHRRFYTRDPFGNRLELLAAETGKG
jgi:catechol 2,3-dioxygenase-like lactoylglutathione lyase family enzyme